MAKAMTELVAAEAGKTACRLLAGLGALLALGCADDPGAEPTEAERAEVTECGGREFYIFSRINRKLTHYPELSDYVGLTNVETCEQARTFMKRKQEFVLANPDYFFAEAEVGIGDDLDEARPAEEDGPGGMTDKIRQGEPTAEPATVGLLIREEEDPDNPTHCSGFFVDKTHIITAAHCVPPIETADGKDFVDRTLETAVFVTRTDDPFFFPETSLFNFELDGKTPIFKKILWQPHGSYSGEGDFDDDIAVGTIVDGFAIGLLPDPDPDDASGTAMRFWLGSVRIGETGLAFVGYGPNSSDGTGGEDQRTGFTTVTATTSFQIAGRPFSGFPTTSCKGDSGGPILNVMPNLRPVAYGVTVGISVEEETQSCADLDGTHFWLRLRPKRSFIEQKIGRQCTPFKAFVDGFFQVYVRCFDPLE
jgi:hypothetical protein